MQEIMTCAQIAEQQPIISLPGMGRFRVEKVTPPDGNRCVVNMLSIQQLIADYCNDETKPKPAEGAKMTLKLKVVPKQASDGTVGF